MGPRISETKRSLSTDSFHKIIFVPGLYVVGGMFYCMPG